ncbi:hypothetical protein CHUAL_010379 [Chamberlinius hualienensis]
MAKSNKHSDVFKLITVLTIIIGLSALGEQKEDVETPSIVCYVASWARYRTDDGFFDSTSFNPNLCTHVVYSFVGLDPATNKIKSLDPQADLNGDEGGKEGFKSMTNLKLRNPSLKTLVAIGGWTQGSENYSIMASSPEKRNTFVSSVVEFLRKYQFDGLDIDWEYPTQRGGKPEDKQNFVSLLKDLRAAFKNDWIISVAVAAPMYIINEAYDVPIISSLVDIINIMTYDYHGKWDNKTGHNCPLYQRADGHDAITNVNNTIHHYIRLGAQRRKLHLGLPFFGRTFTLDDPKNASVGAPSHKEGPKGKWTQEAGFMGYNELCQEITSSTYVKRDHEQHVPYAVKGDSWISFDDPISIKKKVEYAINNNLGGVLIWSIDMDDVKGRCHGKPMPLLKTINEVYEIAFNKTNNVVPDYVPEDPDYNEVDVGNANGQSSICTVSVWLLFLAWELLFVIQ